MRKFENLEMQRASCLKPKAYCVEDLYRQLHSINTDERYVELIIEKIKRYKKMNNNRREQKA